MSGASVSFPARTALSREAEALALLDRLAPVGEGQPRAVVLNGQRLIFRSRTTEQPVHAVLDAFERECDRGGDPPPAPGVAELREPRLAARHADPRGDVGQSACFASSDARSLGERLWGFVRDGDLSSLGQARYLLARRTPGAAGTHVLELWAPGAFSLRALLDVPATPLAAHPVPAPAQVEALLEARVEGEPHALHVYTSPELPASLLDRYTRQLVASGFELVGSPDPRAAESRALLGIELATLVSVSRAGDQTLLSRVDLPRPRRAAIAEVAP